MPSLTKSLTTKIVITSISTNKRKSFLSKTQRKKYTEDTALSKNNGADVRYRKRLMDEQEAYEELKRSLKELEKKEQNVQSDS